MRLPAARSNVLAALPAALVAVWAASAGAASAGAQTPESVARRDGSRAGACDPDDAYNDNSSYRGYACERRTLSLRPRRELRLDAGPNGGATVRGEDDARAPLVTAVVTANARTDDEAAALAAAVEIVDDGGTLRARGPDRGFDDRGRRAWWSVSWRVEVPRRTDLDVRANNGGVRVARVAGRIRLHSNNGGVSLDSVGGDVEAHTNNGGARATLAGRGWDAAGQADAHLDLHSNNGGAVLRLPADYAARVSVGTNNGSLAVDFPVTVQGRLNPRRLELTLGGGGAPIRVTTNNGGARLGRVE